MRGIRINWLAIIVLAVTSLLSFSGAHAQRIMPLGDSITGSPGCWRAYLWQKLELAGYTGLDFVGTLGPQGCAVSHDGDNEGHGGILATNMANLGQLDPWLDATNPEIVLMHLGTNDAWSGRSPSVMLTAFTRLIESMRRNNSSVTVLVAQIIPMDPAGSCAQCDVRVMALNEAIPAWAAAMSTAASPIIVVDQWTGFDAVADTNDGVHPNAVGDQKMADVWFDALVNVLENNPISSASSVSSAVSSESSSSSVDSSIVSSSSASAVTQECTTMCRWYQDDPRTLCENQSSGWGWENQQSCIGLDTCNSQSGTGGTVEICTGTRSSVVSSSITSSISSVALSSSSVASVEQSSSSSEEGASSSSQPWVGEVTCSVAKENVWNSGYQLDIVIGNEGASVVEAWEVSLVFDRAPNLTGSWNVNLTEEATSLSATGVGWNSNIAPGGTVSFGFQGSYSGNFVAPSCVVTP